MKSAPAACGLTLGLIGAAAAVAQPRAVAPAVHAAGTWDLEWATRRGPERRGYLVITQHGSAMRAEIHGRGSVRARGTLSGRRFELRGSRMMAPYRIAGEIAGDRLTASLKVLSLERHFTERRR